MKTTLTLNSTRDINARLHAANLVVFSDEGHWILKPANSQFWYTTVLDWLDAHLKPKA